MVGRGSAEPLPPGLAEGTRAKEGVRVEGVWCRQGVGVVWAVQCQPQGGGWDTVGCGSRGLVGPQGCALGGDDWSHGGRGGVLAR